VGLVVTGRPLLDAARRKPPTAFPARSVLMGAVWLTGSIVVLVAQLAASGRGVDAARLGWVTPALLVGFAAQVLVGGLTFLTPVVLGGGPATARRTIAAAEQLAWPRLVATNAGLLLLVLPVPDPLRAAGRVLAVTGLAVTVPLLVHSAVVARRERLTRR
jgi:nitrite reductase (NO-forming)